MSQKEQYKTALITRREVKKSLNPFPNNKFETRPNSKTLQTTILSLTKMAESSSNG